MLLTLWWRRAVECRCGELEYACWGQDGVAEDLTLVCVDWTCDIKYDGLDHERD